MTKLNFEVERHEIKSGNIRFGQRKLSPKEGPDGKLILDKLKKGKGLALVLDADEAFCFDFGKDIVGIQAYCNSHINGRRVSGISVNQESKVIETGLKYYLGKGMVLNLTGFRESGEGINYNIRCSK